MSEWFNFLLTFAFLKTFYRMFSNFIRCKLSFVVVKYIHDNFCRKFNLSMLFTSKKYT